MFKLSKYIFKQLTIATLFITVVLTVAIWLTQSVRFVDFIINKGLAISTFLQLIIYLLPDLISVILPVALLTAILFKYNRLTTDNELIVMRTFGFSNWQLAKPAFYLAVLITITLYFISLYLLPNALRKLRDMEHEIKQTISGSMLQAGEFNSFKGNTVYIHERKGKTELYDLVIHHKQHNQKPLTIIAKKGSVVETDAGAKLVLFNGIKQEFDPQTGKPSMFNFEQYIINLDFGDKQEVERQRKPYEYYITDLLFPNESMAPAEQFSKLRVRAYQKIIAPLHTLVFALLGVITFLYGDYNRRGRSSRIFITAGICVLIQLMTFVLINLSEKVSFFLPLAYLIIALPLLLCLGYLKEWRIFTGKPR